MLALLLVTWAWYPSEAWLARYDFLVLAALALQVLLVALRLETRQEAVVILCFHVVGTAMEVFKTAKGSWVYPEASLLRIVGGRKEKIRAGDVLGALTGEAGFTREQVGKIKWCTRFRSRFCSVSLVLSR